MTYNSKAIPKVEIKTVFVHCIYLKPNSNPITSAALNMLYPAFNFLLLYVIILIEFDKTFVKFVQCNILPWNLLKLR